MTMTAKSIASLALVSALCVAAPGLAAAEQIKGMIIGRDGENMIVRTDSGSQTIALTESTDVKAITGALGAGRSTRLVADLIPGLPVTVDTANEGGRLTATAVRFKSGQLTVAQQVEAGLHPTATTVAAHDVQIETNRINHENLKERFGQLGDYLVKGSTDVLFDTNSAVISAKGKQDLQALATQAKGIKGYLIHISGFADSRGNAAENQKLSQRRAAAVTNYLQQSCGVQLMRVLSPDAMGEVAPTGAPETAAGHAANRKVTVKVVVNKGLHG